MSNEPSAAQHTVSNITGFRRSSTAILSEPTLHASVRDATTVTSAASTRRIKYHATPYDVIKDRYRVGDFIDEGGFGAVYKATDLYTGSVVAVKVFHKGQLPHRDVRTEELIYAKLVAGCSANISLFAEVMDTGEHRGHRFIVLEKCGPTLLNLVNMKSLMPLPRRHVQEIAFQLMQGVAYLHSLGLIHTDLKPDNIALKHAGVVPLRYLDPTEGFRTYHRLLSTQICILDLGGVVEESEDGNEGTVGAVGYRAPEITLGLPFDHSADVFSVGCLVAEACLGHELLPRDIASVREHIALIERVCGPFPLDFALEVEEFKPGTFRIENGSAFVVFPDGEFNANMHTEPLRRLQRVKPLSFRVHDVNLGNLLRRLLEPDPSRRIELNQALRHIYFDDLRTHRM